MAEPFPWREAMRFGFGTLRLSPDQFWSMTMHELHAAMEAHGSDHEPVLNRRDLQNIMAAHPDQHAQQKR
ncbi:MAG: rcc01693 family protein [Pseudomonadota bacterium]